MTEQPHGSLTSRAYESISRRQSLLNLVVLALASTLATPASAKRGKRANRKSKRKAKRHAEQICLAQIEECQDIIFALCRDRDDPAACAAPSLPCCEPLATCDATAMLDCFFAFSVTFADWAL